MIMQYDMIEAVEAERQALLKTKPGRDCQIVVVLDYRAGALAPKVSARLVIKRKRKARAVDKNQTDLFA